MTAAHDRAYKRLIMGTMVNIACEPSLYEELEGQARFRIFFVVSLLGKQEHSVVSKVHTRCWIDIHRSAKHTHVV